MTTKRMIFLGVLSLTLAVWIVLATSGSAILHSANADTDLDDDPLWGSDVPHTELTGSEGGLVETAAREAIAPTSARSGSVPNKPK